MSRAKNFRKLAWIYILSLTTTLPLSVMLVSTLQRILPAWLIASVFVVGVSYNSLVYYLKTKLPAETNSNTFKRMAKDTSIRIEETSFSMSDLSAKCTVQNSEPGNSATKTAITYVVPENKGALTIGIKQMGTFFTQALSTACHFLLLTVIFFATFRIGTAIYGMFDQYTLMNPQKTVMAKAFHNAVFWSFSVYGLLSVLFAYKLPKLKYIATCMSFVAVFISVVFLCIEGPKSLASLDYEETNDEIFANIWQPFTLLGALFATFPFRYTDHFHKLSSCAFAKARALAMLLGGLTSTFIVYVFGFQFNKIRKDMIHIEEITATALFAPELKFSLPSYATMAEASMPFFFLLGMLWTLALYVFEYALADISALKKSLSSGTSLRISNLAIVKSVCNFCVFIKNRILRAIRSAALRFMSEEKLLKITKNLDLLFDIIAKLANSIVAPVLLFALCTVQIYFESYEFDYLKIVLGTAVFCHFFYFYVFDFFRNLKKSRREVVLRKVVYFCQFIFLAAFILSWIMICVIMREDLAYIILDSRHVVLEPLVVDDY
ncbi:hypothetical protein ENBRE01_1062 [Enteropsectra breve]|nr:hypothetical protein ENBRE01_1062 [Enteropsectra breve]